MPRIDFAFYELLFKILGRRTGEISRVDFKPEKPAFQGGPIEQSFPRATPESQGISSDYVRAYFEALKADPSICPHHAMVLRHGKVIGECSYAPYERGMWHISYSLCKSVTGMAIGLLVSEGKLDLNEKLIDIFPTYSSLVGLFRRQHAVTVRDLLRMTSAVAFSESGAISGNDWRAGFMSASLKEEPGKKWDYNSMNSYMLSAIVTDRTGETMMDYLRPRLFEPLGITEVFWESCPMGITKGGWGMFLRPEDAAKLGQLYLDRGRWKGQTIIPEEWVAESTRVQVDNGRFGYGYQIWMDERPGSFVFNGMLGQDVVVCPDTEMVLVVNAGNEEMTQNGRMTAIMRRFWGADWWPSDGYREDPAALRRLESSVARLEGRGTYTAPIHRGGWGRRGKPRQGVSPDALVRLLDGRSYELEDKSIGLMPLIMQVFHNNFTDGISRVSFSGGGARLFVTLHEGAEDYVLPVGFGRAEKTTLLFRGDPYITAVSGVINTDEKDRIALTLEVDFIEEACGRKMKFYFSGDTLELRANEKPGNVIIRKGLAVAGGAGTSLQKLPLVGRFAGEGGIEVLNGAVRAAIFPVTFGTLIGPETDEPGAAMSAPEEEEGAGRSPEPRGAAGNDSDGGETERFAAEEGEPAGPGPDSGEDEPDISSEANRLRPDPSEEDAMPAEGPVFAEIEEISDPAEEELFEPDGFEDRPDGEPRPSRKED